MGGFCGRLLRVDLTTGRVRTEPLDPFTARRAIGPRGLAAAYLLPELDPQADPQGPANKLAFAAGVCAGLPLPGFSRVVVAGLSPLTGLYGEAGVGGGWGAALKHSGFDLCLIEGSAPAPVYLEIGQGTAKLRDAACLWGLTTSETERALRRSLSTQRVQVVSIGQGGENRAPFACILHGEWNTAGSAGLGAVMGGKRLKAVVVRDPETAGEPAGPRGCDGCPLHCRRAVPGRKTRSAFAGLGLADDGAVEEANRLCNEYGLDALAVAALLQGRLNGGRGAAREVLRQIVLLGEGRLSCPPAAAPVRPAARGGPGSAPAQPAVEVLGVCKWLGAPSGPLSLQNILDVVRTATGWRLTQQELVRAGERTESAIQAFNRLIRATG